MAKTIASTVPEPVKLAGGIVLLGASVALMIHRMPHREYAAVHEDNPHPHSFASRPVPVPPVPAAAAAAPPAEPEVRVSGLAAADAGPLPVPAAPINWNDDCTPEIGVLCHDVPSRQLKACLLGYEDSLLTPCRHDFHRLFPNRDDDD